MSVITSDLIKRLIIKFPMNVISYSYKTKNAGVTNAMDAFNNLTPSKFFDNISPSENGKIRG